MARNDPPAWALDFLRQARVGHLATASAEAMPHVIPICFAVVDDAIYSVVDEKPKSGRRLLRLRNIDATGQAALVVDRYDEDWSQLAWVMVRGRARAISASEPAYATALAALREKYPQYRSMDLNDSEMIELKVDRYSWWRAD